MILERTPVITSKELETAAVNDFAIKQTVNEALTFSRNLIKPAHSPYLLWLVYEEPKGHLIVHASSKAFLIGYLLYELQPGKTARLVRPYCFLDFRQSEPDVFPQAMKTAAKLILDELKHSTQLCAIPVVDDIHLFLSTHWQHPETKAAPETQKPVHWISQI